MKCCQEFWRKTPSPSCHPSRRRIDSSDLDPCNTCFLRPTRVSFQTASRSVHPCLRTRQENIPMLRFNGAADSPQNCPYALPKSPRFTLVFLHMSGISVARFLKFLFTCRPQQVSALGGQTTSKRAWSKLRGPFVNFGASILSMECQKLASSKWFFGPTWVSPQRQIDRFSLPL